MEGVHVVTCFLRNRAEVLLLRRSGAVGSYRGKWGAVAGHVEPESGSAGEGRRDPDAAAREEVAEEAGLADAATLACRGDPFPVVDEDRGTRWVVYPYLFDCDSRAVTTNEETDEHEWVPPTAILRRETVPDLWTSYDRVRPTVETVAGDSEHGSAYVSLRALEVLRDEAALGVERGTVGWPGLADLARELLTARPSMTAVRNRINRVMDAAAEDGTAAVEAAASEGIADALAADADAAAAAAGRLAGGKLVTLSRSGTVEAALAGADPAAVLVAESRPGGEGIKVAERLADDGVDVTLVPDAALAHALAGGGSETPPADAPDGERERGGYDAVVVGADTVLPDGAVVNKVGTRALALAAAREGVPVYVVAARDKISPDPAPRLEAGDPAAVYDGSADVSVSVPLFDVTPPDPVTGVVTEEGVLDADEVAEVADSHRDRAGWAEAAGDG